MAKNVKKMILHKRIRVYSLHEVPRVINDAFPASHIIVYMVVADEGAHNISRFEHSREEAGVDKGSAGPLLADAFSLSAFAL